MSETDQIRHFTRSLCATTRQAVTTQMPTSLLHAKAIAAKVDSYTECRLCKGEFTPGHKCRNTQNNNLNNQNNNSNFQNIKYSPNKTNTNNFRSNNKNISGNYNNNYNNSLYHRDNKNQNNPSNFSQLNSFNPSYPDPNKNNQNTYTYNNNFNKNSNPNTNNPQISPNNSPPFQPSNQTLTALHILSRTLKPTQLRSKALAEHQMLQSAGFKLKLHHCSKKHPLHFLRIAPTLTTRQQVSGSKEPGLT